MQTGARAAGFAVDDLIACYQRGVFPMADAREDERIFLIDPDRRGVIPLADFHVPRRLARTVRRDLFTVRVDGAYAAVIEACAESRPGRLETWINAPIQSLYGDLYARGLAHSIECWDGAALVGGLYGVAIGAAFFGESMFSIARDASKVALTHLVARLVVGGYQLLDTQFLTSHLAQFGAQDIPRAQYRKRLTHALATDGDFFRMPAYAPGASVLQAISQAS
ncbi:MAG TPA: leucyl/phenylalanyl-tRNA--protein transferase [Caulobacteraceae bacterium]|nr:leucyl/phenylalanyl-tRNA--protein transferase [Caulobacteraceae bacterium]